MAETYTYHILESGQGNVRRQRTMRDNDDDAIDSREELEERGEETIEIEDAKGKTIWKNRRYD